MIGRWKAGLQRGERKGGDRLRVSGAGQDSGQAECANCAPGKGPRPSAPSAAPQLTRWPHPGPRPGPLHLPAVAVHTPAVAGAAVALDGRVVAVFVTLGDEEPGRPGPLGVHRPKDVFPLKLASGFLHFCPREGQKEGRQFKSPNPTRNLGSCLVITPFCFINLKNFLFTFIEGCLLTYNILFVSGT